MLLGIVAGFAYCSWPIGFLVNPSLAATALASDLEAHGQTYAWLFILLDCVTGIATLLVVRFAWPTRYAHDERLIRFALIGYLIFGVATAIDALIPVGCGSSALRSCSANLSNLNWDDFLTGIAVFALFIAAVCAQIWAVQKRSWEPHLIVSLVLIILWSGCGLAFFAVHFSSNPNVALQHVVLTLSSTVVPIVPAVIMLTRRRVDVV